MSKLRTVSRRLDYGRWQETIVEYPGDIGRIRLRPVSFSPTLEDATTIYWEVDAPSNIEVRKRSREQGTTSFMVMGSHVNLHLLSNARRNFWETLLFFPTGHEPASMTLESITGKGIACVWHAPEEVRITRR